MVDLPRHNFYHLLKNCSKLRPAPGQNRSRHTFAFYSPMVPQSKVGCQGDSRRQRVVCWAAFEVRLRVLTGAQQDGAAARRGAASSAPTHTWLSSGFGCGGFLLLFLGAGFGLPGASAFSFSLAMASPSSSAMTKNGVSRRPSRILFT